MAQHQVPREGRQRRVERRQAGVLASRDGATRARASAQSDLAEARSTGVRLADSLERVRTELQQQWIDAEVAETERSLRTLTDPGELRRYPGLAVLDPYFLASADPQTLLGGICQAALQRAGADMVDVQLFDPTGHGLYIAAQDGFERPFLEFFDWIDGKGSACAAAANQRRAVMVPDVARRALFNGESREVMIDAGALAVCSMPLVSPTGRLLGVFSCHYHKAGWPTESDEALGSVLAKAAARGLSWQARQAASHHRDGESEP